VRNPFRRRTDQVERADIGTSEQAIPRRPYPTGGSVVVDPESALRSSAVWACLRLRANLISSLPLDVYRKVDGLQVQVTPPPVLVTPDGDTTSDLAEWLWATQFDLDRFGNVFGLVTARDGLGLPARIELQRCADVTVKAQGATVTGYRVAGKLYQPREVWHERQYRVAGFPVGLSPLTYAAWSISGYLSAQKFGLDFFGAGGMPAGVLKNTAVSILDPSKTDEAKARFKAVTTNRDIFVVGKDWEWTPAASEPAAGAFLEDKRFGLVDIARYFDVPGDMIDAAISGQSVTYANVGQRNVQMLVTALGPAIGRRERALTRLTPAPRTVKLNSDALLRMDPETRQRVILARVAGRTLAPDEARLIDDLPPFTEQQMQQLERLLPTKPIAATPETKA